MITSAELRISVEITPRIVRRAGCLLGEQMADGGDGLGISKGDAAIAATAIQPNEPVLTDHTHFETIPGVEVEPHRE